MLVEIKRFLHAFSYPAMKFIDTTRGPCLNHFPAEYTALEGSQRDID